MKPQSLAAGDPAECVYATTFSEHGHFVVCLLRADGEPVAINCESALSAAALVRAMSPPNAGELLAELAAMH